MKTLVLDASVILSYALANNKNVEIILKPLIKLAENKKIKFLTACFFYIEAVNAVRFEVKDPVKAGQIFRLILDIPMTVINLKPDRYEDVLKMAYENNVTAYDSLYHFIAISRNLTLLTCDRKYYLSAKGLNHIKYIG